MENRVSTPEAGFTIIEVMVAIFLLLLGVLGVATMADNANGVNVTTKARVGATNLAREMLEDARTFDYADLTGAVPPSGSNTALADDYTNISLDDASASISGWQIIRRGITYTVSVFTCVVDDSHDGVRAVANPDVNTAGPYCSGSPAAGSGSTVDPNPDDGRKLEVAVTWTIHGGGVSDVPACAGSGGTSTSAPLAGIGRACVVQSELIPNPAGGLGPAITSLTLQTPGPVEQGSTVGFNATTSTSADSVTWGSDDNQGGAAAGNGAGTAWTFTWNLTSNTPDGSHIVTAQAFVLTAGGVPRQVTANLNRNVPAPPATSGGRVDSRISGQPAAALTWAQNSDTDIIGYTVYRALTAVPLPVTDPPVCSTASVASTECFDAPGPLPTDLASEASPANCAAGSAAQLAGDSCINYYILPFDQKWVTPAMAPLNSDPVRSVLDNCAGSPWAALVVPVPPIPSSRTTSTLSGTSQWANARAGCPSAFIQVDYTADFANPRPAAPTPASPSCTTDSTGQPVINWTPPPVQGNIVSYRIYRDPPQNPPNYNDPAFTIGFGPSSFTDPSPTGGTGHNYYVTTVDSNSQESDPLGPINWTAASCP